MIRLSLVIACVAGGFVSPCSFAAHFQSLTARYPTKLPATQVSLTNFF